MKFHDYADNFTALKKSGLDKLLGVTTREEMYSKFSQMQDNPLGLRHGAFDMAWYDAGKPYYDVYPSVIQMLTKINLEIPGDCVLATREYLPHLLVRLPDCNHQLCYEDPNKGLTHVRTIFISFQRVNKNKGSSVPTLGLVVGLDIGERDESGTIPMHTMKVFPLDDRTIEEVIDSLPAHITASEGMQVPDDLIKQCIRLAVTLRLLEDNPELIEPDVLSKDRHRLNGADDELKQRLIDKARRKGKFGFKVGENIEKNTVSPHYRIPHFAIRWTGPGGKIPKLRPIKGSVIHRDKIEQIPTGFKD